MITANRWFRRILSFAIVLALSFGVAWLFHNDHLVHDTLLWLMLEPLYFPGMMFSVLFVCGVHGGVPEMICYFVGAFLETAVIWLILRAIWRLIAKPKSS